MRAAALVAFAAFGIAGSLPAAGASLSWTVVALSGAQAPDTAAGTLFRAFDIPRLDEAGNVAFRGFLEVGTGDASASNDVGLWTPQGLVAREGDPAPGGSPGQVYGFFRPTLSPHGQLALTGEFAVGVGGTSNSDNVALWGPDGAGGQSLVAREGAAAPGTAGAVFSLLNNLEVNDAGQVAFNGTLGSGIGDVDGTNQHGIWRTGPGGPELVVRSGEQAPDTPSGAELMSIGDPFLNGAGAVAFDGVLRTGAGGVTSSNNRGVWRSTAGGGFELIARSGDQAPGLPTGTTYGLPLLVAQNETNDVAIVSSRTSGTVVFGPDGAGGLTPVARTGSQAPGTPPGAEFASFSNILLNDAGGVALRATLATGSGGVTNANNEGIWAPDGAGGLRLAARRGDLVEGLLGVSFRSFEFPVLNNLGDVAFQARLLDEDGLTRALVVVTSDDQTTVLARTGDPFEVAAGDTRIVSAVWLLAGEFHGGLNDARQLAVMLEFVDTSSGVFLVSVPEPGLALRALPMLVALAAFRGAHRWPWDAL